MVALLCQKLTNQQLISLNLEVSTSLFMLIDKLLTNIGRVGTGWASSNDPADKSASSALTNYNGLLSPKWTEGGSFYPLPLQLLMKCLPEIWYSTKSRLTAKKPRLRMAMIPLVGDWFRWCIAGSFPIHCKQINHTRR